MQFVFFGFQVTEEAPQAAEACFTVDDVVFFLVREIAERNVETNLALFGSTGCALQFQEPLAAFRFSPGLHRSLIERQTLIRNGKVEIVTDGVAEALAARARSGGTVKTEQRRFRFHEIHLALLAREFFAEAQSLARGGVFENGFPRLPVANFNRINHPLAQVRSRFGRNHNAVGQRIKRL